MKKWEKRTKKSKNGLNPFVQVFYSNASPITVKHPKKGFGLNPFVQVFYSNLINLGKTLPDYDASLNPFVQVFYSNRKYTVLE